MANVKIKVDGPLMDGHRITFKAPCDCTTVDKLDVRYVENNTPKSKLFTLSDAQCAELNGVTKMFKEGAYIQVILDIENARAFLMNANTNSTIMDIKSDLSQGLQLARNEIDDLWAAIFDIRKEISGSGEGGSSGSGAS